MENRPHDTFGSPSENTDRIGSGPTLSTPHFDEKSIQNARQAVPLARNKARRFWPLALVLMCGSALVGAVIGIALWRYPNSSAQLSTPATAEGTSPSESDELSQSAADSEQKPNDAGRGNMEANAEATRAPGTRESSAVRGEPISYEQNSEVQNADARPLLKDAFDEWIAATNARDLKRQMSFYHQTVNAFYLTRNVPREAVRAEKSRVFGRADSIDIRAASPAINLSHDGRTATMRFRKKYAIEGGGEDRSGEVVQELRWRRTGGWKIVSERDLRVIQ